MAERKTQEVPLWRQAMAAVDPEGLAALKPGEMPDPERMVEVAIEYGMRQRGRPTLPESDRLQVVSLRVDETTWAALEVLAQKVGQSRTNMCRNILRSHIEDALSVGDLEPKEVTDYMQAQQRDLTSGPKGIERLARKGGPKYGGG